MMMVTHWIRPIVKSGSKKQKKATSVFATVALMTAAGGSKEGWDRQVKSMIYIYSASIWETIGNTGIDLLRRRTPKHDPEIEKG
mmetsp:Transcript_45554/g.51037  ORF Transcript_45554/g.51037 Transcript_45554/m.51037 type:complete len:84 (+) Transcript_45554:126-377(+)